MKNHTISLFTPLNTNNILYICIHYDNYFTISSIFYPADNSLWLANLLFPTTWRIAQEKRLKQPMMRMNSERPNRFSCLHFLVSTWSQQAWRSVAQRQVSVGSKLNSRPTARVSKLAPKNEEVGDGRTCLQTKKHNSLRHFSRRRVKAFQLWWPKFGRHTKQRSIKKFRHPLSTDSWRDTVGTRLRQIGRPRIGSKCHERRGQIPRSSWPHSQSSFCLVYPGPTAPRYHSCRPYLRAAGGAQCFSRIS